MHSLNVIVDCSYFNLCPVFLLSSRFGIEMVSCDQEDQSQEEGDIPLLEGFQWESLMDISAPGASRKRSLSESSLAPGSTHSLFTSLVSKETAQRESLSSEQQGSSVSPSPIFKDNQHQQEVEQMLGQFEAEAQKQPDKLTSATVKALQRSESVLGDSSSGTELYDGQGTGKRRRAIGVSKGNSVKGELFTDLGEYYCICVKSYIKSSVAPEGAARNLINFLN